MHLWHLWHLWKRRLLLSVFLLAGGAAAIRLVHAGWSYGLDFGVYWKATHTWAFEHLSPYLFDPSDQGFVFKYPPWILPLFYPFGWVSLETGKILWGLLELASLAAASLWLFRAGIRLRILLLVNILFWWIWLGHFYFGQLTLLLLASALWAVPPKGETFKTIRLAALAALFSAKIFSLVSLLGFGERVFRLRFIAATLGWIAGLSAVTALLFLLHGVDVSPWTLLLQWVHSASSGGAELGNDIVRGQMNHGFTAGILRWLEVPATVVWADFVVFGILFAGFGSLWGFFSKKLRFQERWAGWLALGVIVHPLAWHHSFVLTFPLCAFALDKSLSSGSRGLIILSALGTCCIGILIPNIFGLTLITPLELLSVKSWGVCLCALALLRAEQVATR
ncbi:MAG TPA: hypothetical protein DCS07_00625 [Bdellovibrionales bacterium]|nr:MAG: hypothetical protein A2Z97_11745 [Bdellovibrionales bacterium GWB1_52_6]OFZ05365.1 MAG: hypothetical protein A2X97_16605 [Bdellovibrionales bacterium GWA1_52_35]OFZ43090.1 MAG: hypothetical protein A2070_01675 [Bdellovibrionales bacterium GWC1_52_8]HAR41135.1 hypothetical protein [Bdellovibrionales bacterium]HCM38992.1 hypothetical protein [Bdellovibrionales bacterium]